jgi:hypothetical protein
MFFAWGMHQRRLMVLVVTALAAMLVSSCGGVAAALSLPLTTGDGAPFPMRDLISFLTFAVILATLVNQGLTLPPLIRALGLEDDGIDEREEAEGRIEAALQRLQELGDEEWVPEDAADRLRAVHRYRRKRFASCLDEEGPGQTNGRDEHYEERSADYRRLSRELILAQRSAVVRLRNEGRIGDEALRRIEHDLDLDGAYRRGETTPGHGCATPRRYRGSLGTTVGEVGPCTERWQKRRRAAQGTKAAGAKELGRPVEVAEVTVLSPDPNEAGIAWWMCRAGWYGWRVRCGRVGDDLPELSVGETAGKSTAARAAVRRRAQGNAREEALQSEKGEGRDRF